MLSPTICASLALISTLADQREISGRKSVVLESSSARLVVDLSGGAIGEFKFKQSDLNPLNWNAPGANDTSVHGFGHFLCLDRWGPPSDAEGKLGMPYHGEASNVRWNVENDSSHTAVLSARLPKAGLSVRRTISISPNEAVFFVEEEVVNENALGRVFNIVQHPTIAPPFLDPTTMVDCNGRKGFAQGGTLPDPEEPSTTWPKAQKKNGETVDLRHLTKDPDPNVVSYIIEDALGWVTAANASRELLIGYAWRTSDYPWVSLWRDVRDGKPAARGLEFGSTGLHQPFPLLTTKGRIWDRPLFEYIDAKQKISKKYMSFLLKIPADFAGVDSIELSGKKLLIREKKSAKQREFTVSLDGGAF